MMIPPRLREKSYRESRYGNNEHSWSTTYNRHTAGGSSLVGAGLGARRMSDVLNGRPPTDPSLYYDVAPASWAFASAMKSEKRRSMSMVRVGSINRFLACALGLLAPPPQPCRHYVHLLHVTCDTYRVRHYHRHHPTPRAAHHISHHSAHLNLLPSV